MKRFFFELVDNELHRDDFAKKMTFIPHSNTCNMQIYSKMKVKRFFLSIALIL